MRPLIKALIAFAGFTGNHDRTLLQLRTHFADGSLSFLSHPYRDTLKVDTYLRMVAGAVVQSIFGDHPIAGFCEPKTSNCALVEGGNRKDRCKRPADQLACVRGRPRMLVFVCHPKIYEEAIEKLGRSVLIFKCEQEIIDDILKLQNFLDGTLLQVDEARLALQNMPRNFLVAWLPYVNFQSISGKEICQEIQAAPEKTSQILQKWHHNLWDSKFKNPAKSFMIGAYKINKRVGFQRDTLHDKAHIGIFSRTDAFHLLNAYHLYGYAVSPELHFDVSPDRRGKPINLVFTDILTGLKSKRSERHMNITPCDRLLGEGSPPDKKQQ